MTSLTNRLVSKLAIFVSQKKVTDTVKNEKKCYFSMHIRVYILANIEYHKYFFWEIRKFRELHFFRHISDNRQEKVSSNACRWATGDCTVLHIKTHWMKKKSILRYNGFYASVRKAYFPNIQFYVSILSMLKIKVKNYSITKSKMLHLIFLS